MDDVTRMITDKFAAFAEQQDPARLYEALDILEAAERDLPRGDTARGSAIESRLAFLAALDAHIDPHWEAARQPIVGVPPPPSHRGPVYPTGQVDPNDIADPAERAEYELALATGKAEARRYDIQAQLRDIDERATRFLALFLAERYSDTRADRQAFEELLSASPLSEERMAALRALFPGSR